MLTTSLLVACLFFCSNAFNPLSLNCHVVRFPSLPAIHRFSLFSPSFKHHMHILFAEKNEDKEDEVEITTKKYGLEAGLLKAATTEGNKTSASDLLKKYGVAYLATSISLAMISYGLCYVLVANGIDVASLLEKVGMKATATASSAGTAGIAYAIHKAASPIRFPPTVALTPFVASLLGKKPNETQN